jgi:hypothetical protein
MTASVSNAADDVDDFVDYRMTFGQRRHKTSKPESFSRSISHPGANLIKPFFFVTNREVK